MIAMLVMQMAVHQITDMVAVRHCFMAASRSMHMSFLVPAAVVVRRAAIGVFIGDFNHMLVHMVLVRVMKVTVMQVVHMVVVLDRRVTAIWTVLMRVGFVMGKIASHSSVSLLQCSHACSMAFVTRFKTWSSAMA